MKALVPAYVWPGDNLAWDVLVADRPELVVANVDSGPGSYRDERWAYQLSRCAAHGIRVLGYVALRYGARDAGQVLDEAQRWQGHYGSMIAGIFWDEAPTSPMTLLRAVHGYARRADRTGLSVFNPGAGDNQPTRGELWWAMARLPGSIWCTWEGAAAYYTGTRPGWFAGRRAHLVHSCPPGELDTIRTRLAASGAGYGYATTGLLPNPWGVYTPLT